MVICLEHGADCLHMVQLMPLHPKTPSSLVSFKSNSGFTFLVSVYPGCPGKQAIERVSYSSSVYFTVPSPIPSTHLGIWACGST